MFAGGDIDSERHPKYIPTDTDRENDMEKKITLEVTVREMEMLMEATKMAYFRFSRPECTEHCRNVTAPVYGELSDRLYYQLVDYYDKEVEKAAKGNH